MLGDNKCKLHRSIEDVYFLLCHGGKRNQRYNTVVVINNIVGFCMFVLDIHI